MIEPRRDADPAVQASDLSLRFPAHGGAQAYTAVEGVSLRVPAGQVRAFLGESGSGKSTLLRFLAGRGDEPSDRGARVRVLGGEAETLGVPLRKLGRRSATRLTAHVGLLPQAAGDKLPAELSISDIVLQPITERLRDFDRQEVGEQIAEMLDLVGLPIALLQRYPHELSKGQRQRIAMIRSLMLGPALYIADEPTLGIDAEGRPRIVDLLRWYRSRTTATMLLVTHDIGMLEALVEQVVVLQQGRMVGAGDINEIFRHADHSYVQQLAQALRATAYDEIAE